jgi:putative hemolysin
MTPLTKGRYTVRPAVQDDMAAIFGLRAVCFGAAGAVADRCDATATHVLVCDAQTQVAVAAFRMSVLDGAQIGHSYAAQFYGLEALTAFDGPMLELGRFCIHPAHSDPDILRIAWAALTACVDGRGVQMLFGCSSFAGTQTAPYMDAFALLRARHLGPARWLPAVKAAEVFRYAAQINARPDLARAHAAMPPLLRTYLMMGGWVSDHAVVDRAMGTLHVFTALETRAIPPARKRLLRALV